MEKKNLKTIKLKGRDYVQVNERVSYFNETYKNGMITTEPTFNDDTVYFKATIYPDAKDKERFFTGHSFGSLKGEKALEKLETVAVGRALAFIGIGIVESIASSDEMAKFHTSESLGICSTCGSEMKRSKAGNLYCPKSYTDPKHKPTPMSKEDQDFLDNLPN
jgi:hypothetical protein